MLNIEKYRTKLENYEIPLDCYIREIREKCKEENDSCGSKRCVECRKENIEWLLSEAQILDDAEKAYLSAVIKPFRKKVEYIAIWGAWNGSKQFVHIELYDDDYMNFPNFEKNTMYKGMEPRKHYSLEELGL